MNTTPIRTITKPVIIPVQIRLNEPFILKKQEEQDKLRLQNDLQLVLAKIEYWKMKGKGQETMIKQLQETAMKLQAGIQLDISQERTKHDALAYLDQLYVTASRLYHSLSLTQHDYLAYQLALLYQCINRQGVPFISYKQRIEQRFDEIKLAAKSMIQPDQIEWLSCLTLDIISQITDPSSLLK